MSTENTIVDVDTDDLDAFNTLLHGKAQEVPKDDDPKEDIVEDDAALEQEDTHETEDDDLAEQNDEQEEEAPKPKPKTRAEKRIEQLLEDARIQRERAERAEAKLNERKESEPSSAPKPVVNKADNDNAPHPDDVNEDGSEKYPLGMFDPQFAEDHIKYRLDKEFEARKQIEQQQKEEAEARQAQESLTNAWNDKLEPARERYPDFTEKGEELLETFADLDQAYGEYLTSTIMGMDYGPDVLYYLSNNIDEAQRIVQLGPRAATIALGRIEARFDANDVEEKPKPRPRLSKAPTPPPTNRGSASALPEVPDDTDDLDAFASKLFKKERK